MALTNNIISGPCPDVNYNAYTEPGQVYEFKFVVTLADIVALGAFLTGDIVLMNLPKRGSITHTFMKHTQAVAGPSIASATAQITDGTNNYSTAFDVFQAVADTAAARDAFLSTTPALMEGINTALSAVTPIKLHLIATGANLGVATAGNIEVTIGYRTVP